jgi:glycosyltransferase involved in cell wall biosynthesis
VGPRNRNDPKAGYYAKIQTLLRDLAIENQVVHFPFTDNVTTFYHAADLFVLPSRQEGMANVVLEAMACGTPVIATRISGTDDIIKDDSQGLRVSVNDIDQLTQAMASLIEDPEKRKSMQAISVERIASDFNLRGTAQSYLDLFHSVCQ